MAQGKRIFEMTTRTAEEAKANYVKKMGDALGTQFAELWLEVENLSAAWGEYVELFAEPDSVVVLNQTAPALFRIIQVFLWEHMLLRIARLTDPPTSGKGKENLTILNLPSLVEDRGEKAKLDELASIAKSKTEFCRDWRNRHIAHRDLELLKNGSAKPLEEANGIKVTDALSAIKNVLTEVSWHYMGDNLYFSRNVVGGAGNALSLLRLLQDGLKARGEFK
jgi:AbiU2